MCRRSAGGDVREAEFVPDGELMCAHQSRDLIQPATIVLRAHGNAHVSGAETIEVGPPATGDLRIRQTAIEVNFHDIYVRNGSYRTLPLPGVLGIEAVGIVE